MTNEDPGRDERLLEVALRVTDGLPVDWELERTGRPDEDRGLESLALIASIRAEHRGAEASTGPPLFVWGDQRVLQRLGNGRFGEQYVAWDSTLQREVVLELGATSGRSPGRSSRQVDCLRKLVGVRHPNLLTVHGVKAREGRAGIWFESLRGRSLEEELQDRGPMGAREAALIGLDLCSALAVLHSAGFVHGAIDTAHVIREGVPGSMRNAGRMVLAGLPLPAPGLSRADDLHAVGVLLHRLVTGFDLSEPAPQGGEATPGESRRGLRNIRPDLPMTLVQVIEKAIAPDPEERYRDAVAMQRALLPVLGVEGGFVSRPPRRSWRWRTVLAAAASVALVLAITRSPHRLRALLHRPPKMPAISDLLRLKILGTQSDAWFGYYSGTCAGDVNADGAPDLLWGSPNADDGRGRAYILFGGRQADSIPDVVLDGSTPQENYGTHVAGLGDANGDGFDDFAVSASGDDALFPDAGRVDVHFGGPGLDTRPDVVLAGRRAGAIFGFWVSGVGDLNDDGYADVVVGAPSDDEAGKLSGRAFVFFGGAPMDSIPDLVLSSNSTSAGFGEVVASAGDFNGDGHLDLACGSFAESADGLAAGRVYVYYGGPGLDARPDLVLRGHAPGEALCKAAALGDVNGDGFDDLAVGAEFGDGLQVRSGLVYVYFGGPTLDDIADLVLRGEATHDLFGCWVAGPGDINQDGFADVMVGARRNDAGGRNSGAVYVYFGGSTMDPEPDLHFMGETPNAEMGSACGSAGDFFMDGFPDFFMSSHGSARIDIHDVCRYALPRQPTEPLSKDSPLVLRWSGAERATVSVSVDAGKSWSRIARRAGGRDVNELSFDIPAAISETLLVRLAPTDPTIRGATTAAFPVRHP